MLAASANLRLTPAYDLALLMEHDFTHLREAQVHLAWHTEDERQEVFGRMDLKHERFVMGCNTRDPAT